MLRDNAIILGLSFVGLMLLALISYFFMVDYKYNSVVQGLTESLRSSAIENADHVSRVERGELFIIKDDFEVSFLEKTAKNNNVENAEDSNFQFEYLERENGSIKAIKVLMDDHEEVYQATVIVDISDF